MRPDRNWEQPWLNERKLLRRSERLPDRFEDLYEAALTDIDEGRKTRRNSVVQSFEILWTRVLDQLVVSGDARTLALNDLIDTHILYRCLRSSLDRTPQLAAVRRDIDLIRRNLGEAFAKLSALSSFKELELAEEHFQREYRRGTTIVRQKIDDAMMSRLFEIRSRAALRTSIGQLDELLESVWGMNVGVQRGQPRKYSKDFLILRCARHFEQYRAGTPAKVRAYPDHFDLDPRDFDRGSFYTFVTTVFSTVEVSFRRAAFGLEKSIRDMLRVRKHNPDVDLLIRRTSTPDDLVAFVRLSESKRKRSAT